jgi:hypothetical protein
MTATQKHAWFNLAVVAFSVLTVAVLAPVLGPRRAMGGLGMLGLMGFGVLFFRKRPGSVVTDERDAQIRLRALMLTSALVWIVYVETCVFVPWFYYGEHGAVPVVVIQASVLVAWIFVTVVDSVATLVLYARGGGSDAA